MMAAACCIAAAQPAGALTLLASAMRLMWSPAEACGVSVEGALVCSTDLFGPVICSSVAVTAVDGSGDAIIGNDGQTSAIGARGSPRETRNCAAVIGESPGFTLNAKLLS